MGTKKLESKSQVKQDAETRILLVDDHPIVRQGLAQLINQEQGLEVCGEAENAKQALIAIPELRPDIAIIDVFLKDSNGIDLVKKIQVRYPDLPVLVLSMHDEALYAERAIRAGAKGYIMKQEATEKVLRAIRCVLNGDIYLSEDMASRMLRKLLSAQSECDGPALERLSDRELEVFQLIGQGHGTREIAEMRHLSGKTIEPYREHIKDKLSLRSGRELAQHAIHWVQNEGNG